MTAIGRVQGHNPFSISTFITEHLPTTDTVVKGVAMGLAGYGMHALPVVEITLAAGEVLASVISFQGAVATASVIAITAVAKRAFCPNSSITDDDEISTQNNAKSTVSSKVNSKISNQKKAKRIASSQVNSNISIKKTETSAASSKAEIFLNTALKTAGLVWLQVVRSEFAHQLTENFPSGRDVLPSSLLDSIQHFSVNYISKLSALGYHPSKLELFKNFGNISYITYVSLSAYAEEVIFRGFFQTVLLTELPRAVLPQKYKHLVDHKIAQIFRIAIIPMFFTLAHANMQHPGVVFARYLGGILPSIYRECGMSLTELTVIHAAHNSLYRAYEFGLPDVSKQMQHQLQQCKLIQSQYTHVIKRMIQNKESVRLNYAEILRIMKLGSDEATLQLLKYNRPIESYQLSFLLKGYQLGCPGISQW